MKIREVIDLTHPVREGMPAFDAPWHPRVRVRQLGRIPDVGRESRDVRLGTHTGTHVDAPLHFLADGASIDQVPLDRLVGEVTLVDLAHLGAGDSVTPKVLEDVELSERVVIDFGWARHFGDARRYYADYPHFTADAADALLEAGVRMLGYDTCSPDDPSGPMDGGPDDSPIHKRLLGGGVALVEYLANLDRVPDPEGWHICALPLKVEGGDGAPARVCLFR